MEEIVKKKQWLTNEEISIYSYVLDVFFSFLGKGALIFFIIF